MILLVTGYAASRDGCNAPTAGEKTCDIALTRMKDAAKAANANAVINVSFDSNILTRTAGRTAATASFEVFASETAIELR